MSLILAGLIAAGASGAVVVGRWIAKRRGAPQADAPEAKDEKKEDEPKKDDAPPKKKEDARPMAQKKEAPPEKLDGFPCQLGDVVMRITGEEAWLAGGIILSEEMPIAVLYVAPDAGGGSALYARPAPKDSLFWLEPLDPGAILVGGEPPTSVEHGAIRYDRVRRLPLRPRRIGVGAPDVGDSVVVAEYASAGPERLVLFKASNGTSQAWRGIELEPSAFEVIASGKSTIDDES